MTDIASLANQTALEIGETFAKGDAKPSELTNYLLDRIDGQTSPIFLKKTGDRAQAEASAADKRYAAGKLLSPLDGVPIAWKDLVDMKGEVTTAGSEVYRNAPPAAADAPIVTNLADAGMISLGKVNLTEFAYSGLGLNPHFGTPHNPCDPTTPRSSGGSSSGSGAAIAGGFAPCAIGTDTGGSVRVPAAFNGTIGYKTSEKRIDSTGVFALSRTLDTVGPLGRSVADCIALDALMRGKPVKTLETRPLSTMCFFVPESIVLDDLQEAVAANFENTLRELERAGGTITRGPLPAFETAVHLAIEMGTITAYEAYRAHKELIDNGSIARVDRRVVARTMMGENMTDADFNKLQEERQKGAAEVASAIDGALIAMPTVAHVAPEIGPLEADDDVFHRANLKTLRNTAIGNFLNLPGLALPNGKDGQGMPTSVLISTNGGNDDELLTCGLEIEKIVRAG